MGVNIWGIRWGREVPLTLARGKWRFAHGGRSRWTVFMELFGWRASSRSGKKKTKICREEHNDAGESLMFCTAQPRSTRWRILSYSLRCPNATGTTLYWELIMKQHPCFTLNLFISSLFSALHQFLSIYPPPSCSHWPTPASVASGPCSADPPALWLCPASPQQEQE